MTAPSKCRWFRFGLRAMFVMVTLACVALGWLVWQVQVVRERKAIIEELDGKHWALQVGRSQRTLEPIGFTLEEAPHIELPAIRKWLGDDAFLDISWYADFVEIPTSRIERAFPEAQLYILNAVDREFVSIDRGATVVAFRDSLFKPNDEREPNYGSIFNTGLIEK